ncbi:MAG: hypothetical protein JNL87_07480 [Burkholderiaceae bacterium]|nr:hypothetical protein [Burkholderiaceae bacterium]
MSWRAAPAAQAAVGLVLGLWLGAASAVDEAPPSPGDRHSAECVAALEALSEALALRIKAGQGDLRPQLLSHLEQGAAFIGAAYLNGERDEARSRALLDAARERQTALSAAELAQRQALCADEASNLLAEASALGRAVVGRLARRQMDKLLDR